MKMIVQLSSYEVQQAIVDYVRARLPTATDGREWKFKILVPDLKETPPAMEVSCEQCVKPTVGR